jgi:Protein of unknown function (DUF2853)
LVDLSGSIDHGTALRRIDMAENWAADVKKYVPNADEKAIDGIVKYCGIALQKRDSSLVSFTDKEEVARVRNNFLKKKLGLTQSDSESSARRSGLDTGMAQRVHPGPVARG